MGMTILQIGLMGLATQFAVLWAFVSISQTNFAATGKPVVVVFGIVALTLVLWFGVTRVKKRSHLLALPLVMALGYLVAFFTLGRFVFRGLLSGATGSVDYAGSIFRVGCVLLVIYAVATALIYLLARLLRQITRR